jgi:cellulose synthase/poly-beta-1,6-N-acetylglucosamine synthase-like glycosyltransferase
MGSDDLAFLSGQWECLPMFQIVVPAFNEEGILEYILQHAMDAGYLEHLILVDDASTDTTPKILEWWAANFGLMSIRLQQNCKKEGAIRIAMEELQDAGELRPYTLLLDADSMLVDDTLGRSVISQIERCIDNMQQFDYKALALRIDAFQRPNATLFEACALADYTAMQVDQWLCGHQGQLWVINGPGGLFDSTNLLSILQAIEPDFETGDLLITVKLMIQRQKIGFCPSFCVETFVPRDLKSYFNQRRRWERGTTQVLWNERGFYLSLFRRLCLLALLTVIHMFVYFGLLAVLVLMIIGTMSWLKLGFILFASVILWFIVSVLKGVVIKVKRPTFRFWRYCGYAMINSGLWLLVTTPARLTGFVEGVLKIFLGRACPVQQTRELVKPTWLSVIPSTNTSNVEIEDTTS